MKKLLIALLALSANLSAQTFDFSCVEEETLLGVWLPAWTNQTFSFDQTMDIYNLSTGAIIETNTRTHEILHTSEFRWTLDETNATLFLRKQYISIQTSIDTVRRVPYSVRTNRTFRNTNGVGIGEWGPRNPENPENIGFEFTQSAKSYYVTDFPVVIQENSNLDGVPYRTATRTVEYVPTTLRAFVNLNFPGGAVGGVSQRYDIEFEGQILYSNTVTLRHGLLVLESSWETAIGIDINGDGDMVDLVERNVINYAPQQTGSYNYIDVPESLTESFTASFGYGIIPGSLVWTVTENRKG